MTGRPGAAFGLLLQRWRIAAGLTQQELADRSGLSVRGISDLERGLKRRPRPHTVRVLADTLDLPADERPAFFLAAGAGPISRGFTLGRVTPRVTARPPVPIPDGPLFGRDDILSEALAHLREPETRIVTLAGPPGSGRTRVLLEAAHRGGDGFRDGVAYAPLRASRGLEAAVSDIGLAFGLRSLYAPDPVEALASALTGLHALLLLDDLDREAVPDDVLLPLLERCPSLVLMATSERPLGLPGERVAALGPLPMPDGGPVEDDEAPAIRLYRVRARGSVDGRRAAAAAMAAGGMPLAIELAAARRDGEDAFSSPGAAPAPSDPAEAMRRMAAGSIDALSPAEQALLARLSVFQGGFTIAGAHAVAAEPGDSPGRTQELVDSLRDARLLTRSAGPDALRLAIPSAVAREAAARLDADGETAAFRHRHAEWTIAEADRLQHRIFFPPLPHDPGPFVFDAELANIRAAMEWFTATGNAGDGMRLIGAAWFPLSLRGRSREALHWALHLAPPPFSDHDAETMAAMGAIGLGWLAPLADAGATGEAYARLGLARARATEPDLVPLALVVISFSLSAQRRREEAIAVAEEAYALASGPPASRWIGLAANRLGVARENNGDVTGAIAPMQRALEVWRGHAFRWGLSTANNNLADAFFQGGQLARAAALHREVIADDAAGTFPSDPWVVLRSWLGLAEIAIAGGDERRAALMLGAADRFREEHRLVLPGDERAARLAAEWRIRTEIGPSATAALLGEGRALTSDEALAAAAPLAGD